MPARHVVVDGSNIATEGSSLPSLKRLDEAVREFLAENPDDVVTVVVDATFGHRIPPEERPIYEEAENDGDIVSPPAGAIGRGDAFLLRIADKIGAVVLSNDSFQEFHGEYEWLFDKDRLIGGKPVPGVGWIFTPRTPVRGPRSRESVKEAKRKKRTEQGGALDESGLELAAERFAEPGRRAKVAARHSGRRRGSRRAREGRAQTSASPAGGRGALRAAQRAVQLHHVHSHQPARRRSRGHGGGIFFSRRLHLRGRSALLPSAVGHGRRASSLGARGPAQG